MYPDALSVFRNDYPIEFFGLPIVHAEADLHRALRDKLKGLPIELARNILFCQSPNIPLQVRAGSSAAICFTAGTPAPMPQS